MIWIFEGSWKYLLVGVLAYAVVMVDYAEKNQRMNGHGCGRRRRHLKGNGAGEDVDKDQGNRQR